MMIFRDANLRLVAEAHVGSLMVKPFSDILTIAYAVAEGDELKRACYILNHHVLLDKYIFVGDDARTIAANWNLS